MFYLDCVCWSTLCLQEEVLLHSEDLLYADSVTCLFYTLWQWSALVGRESEWAREYSRRDWLLLMGIMRRNMARRKLYPAAYWMANEDILRHGDSNTRRWAINYSFVACICWKTWHLTEDGVFDEAEQPLQRSPLLYVLFMVFRCVEQMTLLLFFPLFFLFIFFSKTRCIYLKQ